MEICDRGIIMNQSDKYYLKQGKLQLSMLDEEEDELETIDFLADLEFPHTKQIKETRSKQVCTKEVKIKITQEIYNNLHTMAQFLTKTENPEVELSSKDFNEQDTQDIIKDRKVQRLYDGENDFKKDRLPIVYQKENPDKELKQGQIDEILEGFFGNIVLRYAHENELKRHIDRQIAMIRDYK